MKILTLEPKFGYHKSFLVRDNYVVTYGIGCPSRHICQAVELFAKSQIKRSNDRRDLLEYLASSQTPMVISAKRRLTLLNDALEEFWNASLIFVLREEERDEEKGFRKSPWKRQKEWQLFPVNLQCEAVILHHLR